MSYPTYEPPADKPAGSTPRYADPKFMTDAVERVAWTAAQAALSTIVVTSFDLPLWLVPIAASVLSAAKAFVAKKIGNPDSASTAPSV